MYATARQKLAAIERTRGDVRASVGLPPIEPTEQASVRAAIERVELTRADPNGTALTVRIHNVTTSVRRNGRIVHERTRSPRVTVGTPILALHDRVSTYEERLNAGLTSPGLEQRLAALLNAAGWTRGYAQYGGVPIGNVISNDHVAVATNAALLDVQRATIGRADQDGVRRLERDLGRLGAQEILALRSTSSPFLERALEDASLAAPNEIEGLDVPARDEPRHIGVNTTASDAFLLMLREPKNLGGLLSYREERSLESVIEAAYTADVRLSTSVLRRSGGRPGSPPAPGSGWTQIDSSLSRSVTVQSAESELPGTATAPWHTLDRFSRTVVTTYDRTAFREVVTGAVDALDADPEPGAVAIQAVDGKRPYRVAGALGVDNAAIYEVATVQDLGDTGAASAPLSLARALAAGVETTLVVGVGSGAGADALVVEHDDAGAVSADLDLDGGANLSYAEYLRQRGEVTSGPPDGGGAYVSVPSWKRSIPQRYRLEAGRCVSCGALNFPPAGACESCNERDGTEPVVLPGTGTVEAVTTISQGGAPPEFAEQQSKSGDFAVAVVAFDGPDGGSVSVPVQVTDADPGSVGVGDAVVAEFRRIYTQEGVTRYGCKVTPAE
mgnify:CR=1 FL=1